MSMDTGTMDQTEKVGVRAADKKAFLIRKIMSRRCLIQDVSSYPKIPNNEIWYWTNNGEIYTSYKGNNFNPVLNNIRISNTYDNIGILKYQNDIIDIVTTAENSFYGYESKLRVLTKIIFPNTAKNICSMGYQNNLSDIYLPAEIESLPTGAFVRNPVIVDRHIYIPSLNFLSISSYTFDAATYLHFKKSMQSLYTSDPIWGAHLDKLIFDL